eukprot:GHVS01039823.1.p2 GENE.GHVS01039823.1~~GHVS01039823.1.p2  ORF type:complete len:103 (-),score=10.65 GHVS01039823.1:480-788(-)
MDGEEVWKDIQRQSLLPRYLYIIKPTYGLSTPSVYKNLNIQKCMETNTTSPTTLLNSFFAPLQSSPSGSSYSLRSSCLNDLEQSAFVLRPELAAMKTDLLSM